ncbi:MAG: hypothetical protein WC531_01640 [Candidatus Paceibacterota bacterium]|jgi:mRNA-degrading endonuclease RelE of RelBE toxin-antitoxin system
MNKFSCLPEFEKELKKLSKKYSSLAQDVEDIKPILLASPTGIGKNFTIINITKRVKIVKVRIQCESLRSRTIRLIYACHEDKIEFIFIELYFKGDKANEDKNRVSQYLKTVV